MEWNRILINKARHMKWSALQRGIPWLFNTVRDAAWLMRYPCAYCGQESTQEHPNGLDRLFRFSPYSPGTVVPCCGRCNRMKGVLDVHIFWYCVRAIAIYLKSGKKEVMGGGNRPIRKDRGSRHAFSNYKASAKQGNKDFGIGRKYFKKRFRARCYYCGRPRGRGVDRVDNTVGYVHGNCVTCCTACNFLKNELPYSVFLKQVLRIHTHFSKHFTTICNHHPRPAFSYGMHERVGPQPPPPEPDVIEAFIPLRYDQHFDRPAIVSSPRCVTNLLVDCDGLTVFNLPRFLSYRRKATACNGKFRIIRQVKARKLGTVKGLRSNLVNRKYDVCFEGTSIACIPAILKLAECIVVYDEQIND
eukprot:GHVU01213083.1.p1 GENE.GHVU01213083.1~~GHVU01213083.1.p1  ORF type:complete len:359 (+),score=5.48 GHVU01213083.1:579-1655(+)